MTGVRVRLSVFVTVGMGRWPFDRLLHAVEPLCAAHEVFVQRGTSTVALPCPSVAFLVLVTVFVVLAYSFSINSALKPFRPSSAVTNVVQPTPIIESRQATPTVTPETIFPANPGTTPVATPTHGSPKPTISLCSRGSDKDQPRISFCGSNFTAGDQVQLVISLAGNQPKVRHPVLVDSRGSFQDSWVIDNCKFMPISVFAEDITPGHTSEVSQVLQNFQFQNCVPPTQGPPSRDW